MVLLRALRRRWDKNVLVFTGHPIELLGDFLTEATGLIDALVSDPFELSTPQTKTLRGSDNQRLHLLTQLGESLFAKYERPITIHDKQLDIMFDDEGTAWLAGIPFRDDMYRLQELLSSQGHSSMVSMAPSTLKRTTT
jgi:anaerobic ribonucleoside-triphosphate reductase activating protein